MYISIDIGGTNTRIGYSKDLTGFKDIQRFPTPNSCANIKGKINSLISEYGGIKAISVGVAGLIDTQQKIVIKSPHISCIDGKHISDIIGDVDKSIIVKVNNDATLAGLAEAIRGEGKGFNRVAYITISTGVGGTLIINKQLPETKYNYEPGHHVISLQGDVLAMDNIRGSWESFSSGTGFKKIYGVDPQDHDDPEIWNEYGENLGTGLYNISILWRPDVIILGGSITKKSRLFLKKTLKRLEETIPSTKPEIRISNLGDSNGLIGGLEVIKQCVNL